MADLVHTWSLDQLNSPSIVYKEGPTLYTVLVGGNKTLILHPMAIKTRAIRTPTNIKYVRIPRERHT